MNYLTPRLKIYKKVKRFNLVDEKYFDNIEAEPISNFPIPILKNEINIFWRQKIWDMAIYRSMEIWKKIPAEKIEASIGTLTVIGKRSLSGKLGNANNIYFMKDHKNNWVYIKEKEHKNEKFYVPLSLEAIEKCKLRAKQFNKK
ncbi:hypothetical protein [Chryseobacterium rhizosphaerae]|uniref:hypothetical protein n=1 Tax=Chryseobacterium rhizosphaerae TaxID=395937 RepID=UPI002359CE58|nr:hypothetical protein [Chryseobacterium rhizosphaerae]MDC8099679.1 hypothetical protein [Chryseobacterium rhizosphaerae]